MYANRLFRCKKLSFFFCLRVNAKINLQTESREGSENHGDTSTTTTVQ